MRFLTRPFYNVLNINPFNFAVVFYAFLTALAIVFNMFPKGTESAVINSVQMMLSFELYDAHKVDFNTYSSASPISHYVQMQQNSMYQQINMAKILLWSLTSVALLVFLFKNPKRKA